jgi:hypothetical protein
MSEKSKDLTTLSREELIKIITEADKELKRVNGLMNFVFERNLHLEEQIKKLSPFGSSKDYNQSWSWVSKLVYCINSIGRPVQSGEIASFLEYADKYFKHYGSNRLNHLSVHLSKAVKYKRLIALKVSGLKAPYYCLPEWYNENGVLREEFKFNPNFK